MNLMTPLFCADGISVKLHRRRDSDDDCPSGSWAAKTRTLRGQRRRPLNSLQGLCRGSLCARPIPASHREPLPAHHSGSVPQPAADRHSHRYQTKDLLSYRHYLFLRTDHENKYCGPGTIRARRLTGKLTADNCHPGIALTTYFTVPLTKLPSRCTQQSCRDRPRVQLRLRVRQTPRRC